MARWRDGGLEAPALSPEWRARLSRRARAEELAALLEEVVGMPPRSLAPTHTVEASR